jgi:Alpha-glutamyl/putrescinyl thymine pyrophosphorylase clade 2
MADLWADYTEFHDHMCRSGDLDPVYPVYRRLADDRAMNRADRVWLVLAHVAYYHTGSALFAFSGANGMRDAGTCRLDLPCATERRGHRSPAALSAHLNDIARRADEILGWCDSVGARCTDPGEGWRYLTGHLATLHGNGRWAAYKTAEMLQHIAGLPIEAPDMGHAFSSGPRKGLALLYDDLPDGNGTAIVRHLDSLSREVVTHLRLAGLDSTPAKAETSLCDFHSLATGRYYVGMDIDVMQQQLTAVPSVLSGAASAARASALPIRYLGELNSREGVDRARRRVYLETGEIVRR